VRDYRIACSEAYLTTTFGRHRFPPWGAASGGNGSPNGVAVIPCGQTEPAVWAGKLARYRLRRGDVVRLITGVGGGYGNPLERDPDLVREDVRNGFLTVEQARRLYGVVLEAGSGQVNRSINAIRLSAETASAIQATYGTSDAIELIERVRNRC
jgi:N-methylhydantoinase B